MDDPFSSRQHITARAICLGQHLELSGFEKVARLNSVPLTVRVGAEGLAVLFRYGVVVFFDVQAAESMAFLDETAERVLDPFADPEWEEAELHLVEDDNEGIRSGAIAIRAFDLQRTLVIADVLAKSVVLAHYEKSLARHFDRIEPLAARLREGRQAGARGRELLTHLGDVLLIESKMIARVEMIEKPDLLWDHPDLERLYLRLVDEYDIAERHTVVTRKLELISRTAETLLGILQHRHSLRVEWYITILIVVEIVITLAEKIF